MLYNRKLILQMYEMKVKKWLDDEVRVSWDATYVRRPSNGKYMKYSIQNICTCWQY